MCLGVPAVVIDVDYDKMIAFLDYGDGVQRSALIGISSERISIGDIVIVHAGVVVSKMSEEEILEQIAFFKEVLGDGSHDLLSLYNALIEKSRRIGKGDGSGDS